MTHPDEVRGEPDYAAQVPRMLSYEHARGGDFVWLGRWWQYFRTWEGGFIAVGAASLAELLDKLESLGADDDHPGA